MKTLKIIMLWLLFLITASVCAQFTRQQAVDLVFNSVIATDTAKINLYVSYNSMQDNDLLALDDFTYLQLPYQSNWVFFVDDVPFANWHHPVRYVCVNTQNGQYTIINHSIYPVELSADFEVLLYQTHLPTGGSNPLAGATSSPMQSTTAQNPNLYAVLITGWNDTKEFWNDISNIYCTLTQVYGYKKENIYVHYTTGQTNTQGGMDLDGGEFSHDIDYSARFGPLEHTFYCLGGQETDPLIPMLEPGDQLFIFFNGHGQAYDNIDGAQMMLPGDILCDTTFARWLSYVECAQLTVVMEPCYSGGFINELSDYNNYDVKCENRVVHSSCEFALSAPEIWVTCDDPNPSMHNLKFGEFVFYWTAAARGYYPDFDEPWNIIFDYPTGTFPLEGYFPPEANHPGDHNPDVNGDGFVQMEEAFAYADFFDSWSPNGVYYPHSEAPGFEEVPVTSNNMGFQEDLLTLTGLTGHVENTQLVESRNYMVGDVLTIDPTVSLTLEEGASIYFGSENADLIAEPGSNLILENDINILGGSTNKISVEGNIQIGTGVTFQNYSGMEFFYGLELKNGLMETDLDQVSFIETALINYGAELNITNSDFTNCVVYSRSGDILVSASEFNHAQLNIENTKSTPDLTAIVDQCLLTNEDYLSAIKIWNYDNYLIMDNVINGYANGIELIQSGGGVSGNQNIINNEIFDCTMAGMSIYNSSASISSNHIYNNMYGIRLFNNSNIALYGDPNATNYSDVNYITNNSGYEVYASAYSFPWYFRYNAIIDEDNLGAPEDPLVYHMDGVNGITTKDVKNNCWGNNFIPSEDLYYQIFLWDPEWCPGGESIVTIPAEELHLEGKGYFESENYQQAKATFLLLIEQFPSTIYATSAMKELISLEKFIDNDYSSLKYYYQTNYSIQSDTALVKLADFLANKCDVEMENWQAAIDHYENIIENPETTEDSIFAIIDLGHTYFLMENSGNRSLAQGKMMEHKPKSYDEFAEKRDYLLSLLPVNKFEKQSINGLETLEAGVLSQNIPNPFKNTTTIYYKLNEQSAVLFKIYDQIGKEIKILDKGIEAQGLNKMDLDMSGCAAGIYFYSIFINGKLSDLKKMVVE
jgi:tetratricopeptide (TPR) repeat protein